MSTLMEIQEAADQLPFEQRAGLAAHLLASLPSAPFGPDEAEADVRDAEMDSGKVSPISYEQFLSAVGRLK
jgi:hypothetical protein